MQGDNAKVVNPVPKAQRVKRQRARVDNAIQILSSQLSSAHAGTFNAREATLRRMLQTLLLCLPEPNTKVRSDEFVMRMIDCAYSDADEMYDMPHVSFDGDLVSIHGNFSLAKLAKKFQW